MGTFTRNIEANLPLTGTGQAAAIGVKVVDTAGTVLVARVVPPDSGIHEDGTSARYYKTIAGWDTAWSGTIIWDDGAGNTIAREDFLPLGTIVMQAPGEAGKTLLNYLNATVAFASGVDAITSNTLNSAHNDIKFYHPFNLAKLVMTVEVDPTNNIRVGYTANNLN